MGFKEEQIKKAILRKEGKIKEYQDKKSIQIAISSAFNAASDICRVLVERNDIPAPPHEDYWKRHTAVYKSILEHFYLAQEEGLNFYADELEEVANNQARKADLHEEAGELHAMDEGTPDQTLL